jgi:hypothetical protein
VQLEVLSECLSQLVVGFKDRVGVAAHCPKFVSIKLAFHSDDSAQIEDRQAVPRRYEQHKNEEERRQQAYQSKGTNQINRSL